MNIILKSVWVATDEHDTHQGEYIVEDDTTRAALKDAGVEFKTVEADNDDMEPIGEQEIIVADSRGYFPASYDFLQDLGAVTYPKRSTPAYEW